MKSRRHFAIMEIINNNRIVTQEELCKALKNRGFKITQATVSRDIKELHLIKILDEKGYRYALPVRQGIRGLKERMKRIFQDSVATIKFGENLIVIKTLPGAAQSVALLIDSLEKPDILGTVAGDDTIFVAVRVKEAVPRVVSEFEQLIK
jgi:transcriptional regulator of arginine metabolism